MAADPKFKDTVLEMLAPLEEVSCKPMFGGYGIFSSGKMFALISGAALFFKVDDSNMAVYQDLGSKQYGSMPYYRVPNAVIENQEDLLEMGRKSIAVAGSAAKKRR